MAESTMSMSTSTIGEDLHKIINQLQQQVAELMTTKETQSPAIQLPTTVTTITTTTSSIINYDTLPYNMTPGHQLNGTNYHKWVHQLHSLLVGQGLLKLILSKEEPLPVTTTMVAVENCQ